MDVAGIRETSAYRIIEQVLEHAWGADEDLSDDEILDTSKMFSETGGKWKELMDGDLSQITKLEECIGNILQIRKINRVAFRVFNSRVM